MRSPRRAAADLPLVAPAGWRPRCFPRIGGYGGAGAQAMAALLLTLTTDDVHGSVEEIVDDDRSLVRVGLLTGDRHLLRWEREFDLLRTGPREMCAALRAAWERSA